MNYEMKLERVECIYNECLIYFEETPNKYWIKIFENKMNNLIDEKIFNNYSINDNQLCITFSKKNFEVLQTIVHLIYLATKKTNENYYENCQNDDHYSRQLNTYLEQLKFYK